MSACGCAADSPQLLLKEAEKPRVAGWLLSAPPKAVCLDPGKKEYEVPELEAANTCKDAYIAKLESRSASQAKALRAIAEPEVAPAAKGKK